ncbi:hypothetical protein [Sodalis sp. (in: enterobacteria)]|uniref:hypothetical protein n=1 Tax=Sodalis sp. (in: enterobacteria) TaxID=1898979 RepID=UPI003F3CA29F
MSITQGKDGFTLNIRLMDNINDEEGKFKMSFSGGRLGIVEDIKSVKGLGEQGYTPLTPVTEATLYECNVSVARYPENDLRITGKIGIRIDPMMETVRIVNSEFKGPGNIELVAQKVGKDKIDFVVYSISR